jgi:L-alanine-DL-glutamate epimerase-like enolase superfamily enzyme
VEDRPLLLVALEDESGLTGYGEAAPLSSYDGTGLEEVHRALDACRGVLSGTDGADHADILARCAEVALAPPALAALDLALWDLEGKRAGAPVWRLLGAAEPGAVEVNWTIASDDRAGAVREAAEARAGGFRTLKVKVGIGDDPGRLAAIRAFAGPQMKIRVDANGSWSEIEARASLRALAPVGIELCEEPVSGVEQIADLSLDSEIPLALDESAADPHALDARACPLMCLKISRCGGLSGLLDTARRARGAGYEVFLASTLDGPLGIAAALHAAALLTPGRASGLATLPVFVGREDPLPAVDGQIEVPRAPGLGDGLLDWY